MLQSYCWFYICDKIIIRGTLIQLIEFMNETLTKIVQSYLYDVTNIVRTKKVWKLLGQMLCILPLISCMCL